MKLLTVRQVVVRIIIIIAVVELLIMLVLRTLPHEIDTYSEAVLDAALLVVFCTPLIYMWIIKPFVNARDVALVQMRHLAHTDPLTQLMNRRLLSEHLEKAVAGSVRHKDYSALLLIDLDGFKLINDRYGHDAGDAVLIETAERLRSATRSEDVVARLGGDEFVVLVQHLGVDERVAHKNVSRVAEKLINSLDAPCDFNDKTLCVGASIGIHLLGFEESDTETAIRGADAAMYRAKQTGGRWAFFFEK